MGDSGELDLTTVDLFATAVDRAGLADRGSEIVVDATGLDFADHRNLLVLEQMADRHGAPSSCAPRATGPSGSSRPWG